MSGMGGCHRIAEMFVQADSVNLDSDCIVAPEVMLMDRFSKPDPGSQVRQPDPGWCQPDPGGQLS